MNLFNATDQKPVHVKTLFMVFTGFLFEIIEKIKTKENIRKDKGEKVHLYLFQQNVVCHYFW